MKNKNLLLLVALMLFSSCHNKSSSFDSSNIPPEVERTPYGNIVKYAEVNNPSDDIEIKVIRDKTGNTRGSNVIYEGFNSLSVGQFKTGDIVRIKSIYQAMEQIGLRLLIEVIILNPLLYYLIHLILLNVDI